MHWYLVFLLLIPAIVMAFLSIRGFTQNYELYLWSFIALGTILIVLKNIHASVIVIFIHLVLVGILWGIVNSMIQAFFFKTYLSNNSRAAKSYKKLAPEMNPRLIILLIGLGTGFATGMVMGIFSVIAKKIMYLI